jgi:hypothetical protein
MRKYFILCGVYFMQINLICVVTFDNTLLSSQTLYIYLHFFEKWDINEDNLNHPLKKKKKKKKKTIQKVPQINKSLLLFSPNKKKE